MKNDFINNFFNKLTQILLISCGKKYQRSGSCNSCGSCCKNISLKHGKKVITTFEQFEELQKKFLVYRMFKIMDNTERGLVFQCVFLDDEAGKCIDYKNRPPICRNYPHEIIFKLGGALSENCGYSFKPIKPFEKVFYEVKNKNDICVYK